mmetsp:Transcript_8593/g.19311  ORF Transcript_8593/g.19311 Transcript_8593/m.19311 type:complete len:432 (-) Transcript_8593:122-1417(-)
MYNKRMSIEETLQCAFSAWDSFRSSMSAEEGEAMKKAMSCRRSSLISVAENGDVDNDSKPNPVDGVLPISSLELSEKEQFHNAVWRTRLKRGSVFSRNYFPSEQERDELHSIIDSLELHDPNGKPGYLDKPGQEETKKAISSIFFQQISETQSVLLKRGPVLVDGDERMLMLFTNGLLFSRIESDGLVNILLDANSEGTKNITIEKLCDRFDDIDVDGSGSLDRGEIRELFQGMGMPLSASSLDGVMETFDVDFDGTISFHEFKSILHQTQQPKSHQNQNLWGSLGKLLKKALDRSDVTPKLDAAFLLSDIDRIENLGVCHLTSTQLLPTSDWARHTFAIFLKEVEEPILVACSKPGHVEPWMHAFSACIESLKQKRHGSHANILPEGSEPGVVLGVKDEKKRKKRTSRDMWKGSTVDWGFTFDETDDSVR